MTSMRTWLTRCYLELICLLLAPWVVSTYFSASLSTISDALSSSYMSIYRGIEATVYADTGALQYQMSADQLTVHPQQKLRAIHPKVLFRVQNSEDNNRDEFKQTMQVIAMSAQLSSEALHFENQVTMSLLGCSQDMDSSCTNNLALKSHQLDYLPNEQYFVARGDVAMTQGRQVISARRISGYLHHQDFTFDRATMTTLKTPRRG